MIDAATGEEAVCPLAIIGLRLTVMENANCYPVTD